MAKSSTETAANREFPTLEAWIRAEAIPFSLDVHEVFNAAVSQVMASLENSVELLGLGETLHGGEDFLILRNRLFQRLVERHGYSAIAIESSFPKGYSANAYVTGTGPDSVEAVQETGFSHGFGRLDANRELVEWMRRYNADPSHPVKLHFYGFDSPTEMYSTDSPRQLLAFALDYLDSVGAAVPEQHQCIHKLLGDDARWENPAAMLDPAQAVGLSPDAAQLRIETEELISVLLTRRPELVARSGLDRFQEAMQFASAARRLLTYHAALARGSDDRFDRLMGLRDAMMADNLAYIVSHERSRGKVLAFAHNSHLKRGLAQWQLGPDLHFWWPVGAHLDALFGQRYVVIGSALGASEANGIGQPEPETLEAQLIASPGPGRFIPTHLGEGLPAAAITALPIRSGSPRNGSYFALTAQSLTDFDWLVTLDSTAYIRGGPSLP